MLLVSKIGRRMAEMYCKNTDGTQYDIGFELVNNLYEIDYCWYDRKQTWLGHTIWKNFFVDLQDAEYPNTLKPEGLWLLRFR